MKMRVVVASILILVLAVGVAVLFWLQDQQIRRGELLVLYPTNGCFQGGPVYVVKNNRLIVNKTHTFPVILWEKNGKIYSQRHMVAYRAYIVVSIPADAEEQSFFRQYFPAKFTS